ncbi:DNA repair protein RadA/Sms [Natranaerovirga hydrolytica]|uniref:DNA repair protein RadA n=1 Tax=Natranaerovirga hydrolytica TaxID=680378 RepID=A0A4R1MIW4_9FIRM|nr:DNA repair protein RadA [Natranaerovirga hydrolytica]TCK92347.1 DNA repair protein RadA/Sms [Natranaerovirga hydrolytica]
MAKIKTIFFCNECGHESAKWLGQCPSCNQWNTFVEEKIKPIKNTSKGLGSEKNEPQKLSDIKMEEDKRIETKIKELDRVLGGGIVIGSLVLVGGDPGIGKSTLLLQMCKHLAAEDKKVLYISGEESLKQIKIRAERLDIDANNLLLLCETNLTNIEDIVKKNMPDVMIIDSIQTMFKEDITSAPGSVSQVREVTNTLMQLAKGLSISTFIVGHVTKEGSIAGPRVLEHMVDTVLYFEGDRHASYRILRGVKNRYGSTNEIGVFEMRDKGLVEVNNPSELMLTGRPTDVSGSVVSCSLEGTRPMLVEVQSLISQTNFGMPRRTATGTDYNRVVLLMAVLEKRLGMQLASCDAYVNIAGGIKINEPALDLGIIMAIASSFKNTPIHSKTIVFGEVGLTGEVRAVNMAEQRVIEAEKLGFDVCIMPKANLKNFKPSNTIKVFGVENVTEALSIVR